MVTSQACIIIMQLCHEGSYLIMYVINMFENNHVHNSNMCTITIYKYMFISDL